MFVKYIIALLGCAFLLAVVTLTPVRAGDPDDTIGGINPNHYVCAFPDHTILNLDSDAFDSSGTFDPEIEVDLEELEDDCDLFDETFDTRIELIRQTRIEGFVFEYHPSPDAPGGWQAVASRDVPVVASGPGFEVFWASEDDGFYYFDYLGAGPITLNLRLPPDAHPLNPNITLISRGFNDRWVVPLGFYRGDTPPDDVEALRLPAGVTALNLLIPGDTIYDASTFFVIDPTTGRILEGGMPDVGGILPSDQSAATVILAVIVLAILPAASIWKLRRRRSNEIEL